MWSRWAVSAAACIERLFSLSLTGNSSTVPTGTTLICLAHAMFSGQTKAGRSVVMESWSGSHDRPRAAGPPRDHDTWVPVSLLYQCARLYRLLPSPIQKFARDRDKHGRIGSLLSRSAFTHSSAGHAACEAQLPRPGPCHGLPDTPSPKPAAKNVDGKKRTRISRRPRPIHRVRVIGRRPTAAPCR